MWWSLTGSIPKGYGPLKTPGSAGSSWSKWLDFRISSLQRNSKQKEYKLCMNESCNQTLASPFTRTLCIRKRISLFLKNPFCFSWRYVLNLHGQPETTRIFPVILGKSRSTNLRPVCFREHGPNTPAWAEHVERFGEAVVVDEPRVNGEGPHQEDHVAAAEHRVEHLH